MQYGPRIEAFVLYLLHYQLLPEKHLARLMADPRIKSGGKPVQGEAGGRDRRPEQPGLAQRFQGFADAVRERVATAPVKHMDETGFRNGGKMQRLLCRACHAENLARERGVPLKQCLIALFERYYDTTLTEGSAADSRGRRNTLGRNVWDGRSASVGSCVAEQAVFSRTTSCRISASVSRTCFAFSPIRGVPFTINLEERDGRMMKLRQKISGGFRSEDDAKHFVVIRSLLSTATEQGWAILQTLTSEPKRLIADLRLVGPLPQYLGSYVFLDIGRERECQYSSGSAVH